MIDPTITSRGPNIVIFDNLFQDFSVMSNFSFVSEITHAFASEFHTFAAFELAELSNHAIISPKSISTSLVLRKIAYRIRPITIKS